MLLKNGLHIHLKTISYPCSIRKPNNIKRYINNWITDLQQNSIKCVIMLNAYALDIVSRILHRGDTKGMRI